LPAGTRALSSDSDQAANSQPAPAPARGGGGASIPDPTQLLRGIFGR
jgi:hypothetical protein